MQTKYNPTGPNVLVELIKPAETTASGIIVPETAQKQTNEGKVLAVGRGWYTRSGTLVPLECQPGERVIWSKHQGTEIEKGLWLVREDDIMGHTEAV